MSGTALRVLVDLAVFLGALVLAGWLARRALRLVGRSIEILFP